MITTKKVIGATATVVVAVTMMLLGMSSNAFVNKSEFSNKEVKEGIIGDTLAAPQINDSTVSAFKDMISVKKTASWATYNGKAKDDDGNPYVKVEFQIGVKPHSKEITDKSRKKIDVVIAANISSEFVGGGDAYVGSYDEKKELSGKGHMLYNLERAISDIAHSVVGYKDADVRVAVITFAKEAEVVFPFSSDMTNFHANVISDLKYKDSANNQAGLLEAQKLLKTSKADYKYLVFMSDGVSYNKFTKEKGTDIASDNKSWQGRYDAYYQQLLDIDRQQAQILRRQNPDVQIYTVSYMDVRDYGASEDYLAPLICKDTSGKKLYYNAVDCNEDKGVRDDSLEPIASEINIDMKRDMDEKVKGILSYTKNSPNWINDTIPPEYSLLEDTVTSDSKSYEKKVYISEDKTEVLWKYKGEKNDTKVYKLSFIMKLNLEKVSKDYLLNKKQIWTNGTTIDVSKKSDNSAIISYHSDANIKQIHLSSPKLVVPIIKEEKEGTVSSSIVSNEGISVKKTASWTTYNGKKEDEEGNPYAKVEFEIEDTESITSKSGKNVDIILITDNIANMSETSRWDITRTDKVIDNLRGFARGLMDYDKANVRIAFMRTDMNTNVLGEGFIQDKRDVEGYLSWITKITGPKAFGLQEPIFKAQRLHQQNTADMRYVILMSNGYTDFTMDSYQLFTPDAGKLDESWDNKIESMHEFLARKQADIMRERIPNVTMVTLGFDDYYLENDKYYYRGEDEPSIRGDELLVRENKLLEAIASVDKSGKKWYYHEKDGNDDFGDILSSLKNRMVMEMNERFGKSRVDSVVDLIPPEYSILEDTVKSDNKLVTSKISEDKRRITWNYNDGQIGNSIQKLSFIVKLDRTKIPKDYLGKNSEVWTNGTTIDINKSSAGSAWVLYDKGRRTEVPSPKLKVPIKEPEDIPSSVTESKDGITIKKTSGYALYKGKDKDSLGNPYVKVDFEVNEEGDIKESGTSSSINGDIVIAIDISDFMHFYLKQTKKTITDFINRMLANNNNVRIALVTYEFDAKVIHQFSSDKDSLISALNKIEACGFSNIQGAVYETQKLFQKSNAKNKYFVLVTDGIPSAHIEEKGPDIAEYNLGVNPSVEAENMEEYIVAVEQFEILKKYVPDLVTFMVGVQWDYSEYLGKKWASKDSNGKKLYYENFDYGDGKLEGLDDTFTSINDYVCKNSDNTKDNVNNLPKNLVDLIPPEYTILEDTITSDSTIVKSQISDDKRKITWNYQDGKLDSNTQKMSFIMKLDMGKVSDEYIKNSSFIWTNGKTIDISKSSANSAWLSYGVNGVIELSSPKLPIYTGASTKTPTSTSTPTVTPTPSPIPSIEFITGEESNRSRVHYMYYMNNKYLRTEEIRFKLKSRAGSNSSAEVSFKTTRNDDGDLMIVKDELISLFDLEGKKVPYNKQRESFSLVTGKEYIIKVNNVKLLEELIKYKTSLNLEVVVNNKKEEYGIKIVKRECFEGH